jgi:hypothetical protein
MQSNFAVNNKEDCLKLHHVDYLMDRYFNKNLLYGLKTKIKLMEFENFYIIILDFISQSSQVAATVGHPNKKPITITPCPYRNVLK